MPPIVIWLVGAIGVAAALKWIAREQQRINAELRPAPAEARDGERVQRLRRDAAGVYRPE